jgi:signal transduction histidine kinase
VQYRYMLEGLDHGWVYAGTRRVAYYTSIPHGRYRFRVSARNELGEWSIPAVVDFELRPHFYQTLWFRVLLALFVVLLGLAAYVIRERTLRSRFALVSAERNRLAREIHDTLAQSFVAVSMRLEVMAQLLKSNDGVERCREQLNQTRNLVRESLAEARRSIWDLRSEGADAQTLPARLARVIQEATAQVPAARMETTGTFRPLPQNIEDQLFRIAQEAIGNAVRHASAHSIRT